MKTVQLSKRLHVISKYVPTGTKVADIGSDHALLPTYLVQKGLSSYVIAGEVNEGPYQAAKRQITDFRLENQVSVRKGNGLEVVHLDEVEVITIAGMGGSLIAGILESGQGVLSSVKRLILQPNVGEELVRKWLDAHEWTIVDEEILEEDDKIYEIIVAEHKEESETETAYHMAGRNKEELYRLGPILFKKKPEVMLKKWKKEMNKIDYVMKQLENAQNDEHKDERLKDWLMEKQWVKGVIECLQKDKPSFNSLNN